MALPRYMVLKSNYNDKYLRYIDEDGQVPEFLQFSGEEAVTPYSKYEVELAKSDKGLVHIRCCYNNKYWVRWSEDHWWIVAGADEPNEDQSSWSCTLFQALYIDGDAQTLRLRHVQLGHYACLWRAAPPYASCLFAGSASPDKDLCDVYTIIDWETPYLALPKYVVLKSNYNNKYLRYIHEDVQVHGFLQFSGKEVVTPYSKYEVELAKRDKGLVHIRCCYNNKYWVRWSENHWWIVAGADEPNEDRSSWSCTLFQPLYADGDAQTLRLRHVQLGHYACLWRAAPPYASCLFAGSASPDKDLCDVYTIIDWESLLILPKHIAFKGNNGYYLRARTIEGHPYLEFASSDIGDPSVGNEIFTTPDGSVRIKSDYFGRFWRRSPNWIWADSDDSTNNNSDTLFWPVRVENNVVALRNYGNNNFCKSLSTEGKTSCLNAAVPTISREARLEVGELVLSRNIYNVNFRLMDARIYDQSVMVMSTGKATNMTSQPNTQELKFTYTETKSRTWMGSVSLKLGVKLTIKSGVPFISEGELEISAEFSGTYEWGETESTTTTLENVYTVTVPPMTRVTVSMLATQGSCDVPFSYSQRDTLTNGKNVIYNMDDGVYTGINCYNFKYETKEEKL